MDRSYREALSASRRRLQNQYAHLDELDAESEDTGVVQAAAELQERIHESRRLLQHPYAYVVDDGFAAVAPDTATTAEDRSTNATRFPSTVNGRFRSSKSFRRAEIERAVKETQRLVWKHRIRQGAQGSAEDPTELLDPAIALMLLGFSVEFEDGLGQFRNGRQLIEVAGLIDTNHKKVKISGQFPPPIRRFTLAHELAHAVLHRELSGIHRDRPLDGVGSSRNPVEWEADRFASLYLMPERLVRQHFGARFGHVPFALSEDTLFALGGHEARTLRGDPVKRTVTRVLAGVERFNGKHFFSMGVQFGVSVEAMAIRLEELELIDVCE
jgi:Zn-dependent peptidase ImmA (M78 family)